MRQSRRATRRYFFFEDRFECLVDFLVESTLVVSLSVVSTGIAPVVSTGVGVMAGVAAVVSRAIESGATAPALLAES